MAKNEGKNAKYKRLLQELGVYTEACDPVIDALCTLERELSRARKAWNATAPKGQAPLATDPLYQVICKQRRDILAYQDALGLTPKGLQRIRRQANPDANAAPPPSVGNTAFANLLSQMQEEASGSGP